MTETAPGKADFEIEDRPAPEGSRGWRGLERTGEEMTAFAAVVVLLVVALLALLIGGGPGLLMAFMLLTLLVFGAIVVISMGT